MASWVARVLGHNGQRRCTPKNEPSTAAVRYPYNILRLSTNSFDANRVVGHGGFGTVYLGELPDGTKIAAKCGSPKCRQGLNEFLTEIEALSELRHRHLVSLIGYCDERNEMILVYEYMAQGTLRSHLYGSGKPSLCWEQRLRVCLGAARGLHYLHTGYKKDIIHRDVKSSNILLNQDLVAKVADLGLSKICTELDLSHVSTNLKFSFGYCDPEYARSGRLTKKSDVYSFGVVLLEVLCARRVVDRTLPCEEVSLTEWGLRCLKAGKLKQIIDPRISVQIRPDSLRKYVQLVEKCLANNGVDRPSMEDILRDLNDVLQLQKADSPPASDGKSSNKTDHHDHSDMAMNQLKNIAVRFLRGDDLPNPRRTRVPDPEDYTNTIAAVFESDPEDYTYVAELVPLFRLHLDPAEVYKIAEQRFHPDDADTSHHRWILCSAVAEALYRLRCACLWDPASSFRGADLVWAELRRAGDVVYVDGVDVRSFDSAVCRSLVMEHKMSLDSTVCVSEDEGTQHDRPHAVDLKILQQISRLVFGDLLEDTVRQLNDDDSERRGHRPPAQRRRQLMRWFILEKK